ncbi:MAG: rod shape-determining protein RodA [Clostridia bacterium]|nr:rod shape-determining protein RodA [Clostridia bacterium]
MKANRKNSLSGKYDPFLCAVVLLTITLGFLAIASATGFEKSRYLLVQGAAVFIGLVLLILLQSVDYRKIGNFSPYIYIVNVLLLILVLFIGKGDEVGTRGWIRFGFIGIQPSEIVKIGFIVTFAKHISLNKDDINNPKTLGLLLLHAAVIVFLILLQPDYGTASVFLVIMFVMLFVSKISIKYILGVVGALAVISPVMWFYVLKDYQKDRLFSFLNPEANIQGSGFHVTQSKLTIGSGGAIGAGLFNGPQTQLGNLPEKHTDFIFAVIGEELGLWGTLLVMILLLCIILKCFYVAQNTNDFFGELICIGVGTMFLFHTFENIGMCIGLTPVTGIPLPFLSYGGSNILASMLAIALVLNVRARQRLLN